MSRIQQRFIELNAKKRTALIPFITAGDPGYEATILLLHALVDAGADVIELGVPFSDPASDGTTIQASSERALKNSIRLEDVLEIVHEFRKQDSTTPIVLMGYLNPIEQMGYENFAITAKKAGVDGVLTVDMPPEEAGELSSALQLAEIDMIFLVAPTTTKKRAEVICRNSSGYIYYVSLKGVTGASHLNVDDVKEKITNLRAITDLPVGVGFGIKDGESAVQIAEFADGVVVGSALVNEVEKLSKLPQVSNEDIKQTVEIIKEMRTAMNL